MESHLLGYLAENEPLLSQGKCSLGPLDNLGLLLLVVYALMVAVGCEHPVLRVVVVGIAVYMVDALIRRQIAPQDALHDQGVLVDISVRGIWVIRTAQGQVGAAPGRSVGHPAGLAEKGELPYTGA